MPELTFLEAAAPRPLAKTYTDEGTNSYPRAKKVTSHISYYDTIEEMLELIQTAGDKGWCLLKGPLIEPLIGESRAGKANREAATEFIVVDVDGFDYKFNTAAGISNQLLETIAEDVIKLLPPDFQEVSYIVQASSSLGLKPDKVSIHLFFMLAKATDPRTLMSILTSMNFGDLELSSQIVLSASGDALGYIIDPSVAHNSRIIYIAPPTFLGARTNPFADNKERFHLVKRGLDKVRITKNPNPNELADNVKNKISELRSAIGLKKRTPRTKVIETNEGRLSVVTNPDRLIMAIARDEGDFVRYNVNDGDSGGYWVHKYTPEIVHNFKGEPNFLFAKADPEAYEAHLEAYPVTTVELKKNGTPEPLFFQDLYESRYYYGYYLPDKDETELYQAKGERFIENFLAEHDRYMPDTIPVWKYVFDPSNNSIVDTDNKFINRFQPPKWIREPGDLEDRFKAATIDAAYGHLEELCPAIHALLWSICGNGPREFEYFINWLAQVVQIKGKAKTAWVFHGVPGTGKGLFYQHVLKPLLGERYVCMKTMQDVEEKFNAWMATTLLFVIDEFRIDKKQKPLLNKLKNMVTETRGTVRAMFADQQEQNLHANLIFFSNDKDAMQIQDGDRRYNVAPEQKVPLKAGPGSWVMNSSVLLDTLPIEVEKFAAYLMHYNVDVKSTMQPLENTAKQLMRVAGEDTIDCYVRALYEGDFEFFAPILEEPPNVYGEDFTNAAKLVLKTIIKEYEHNKEWVLTVSDMMPLFNVLCGKSDSRIKFGKMMNHHGMEMQRRRKRGRAHAENSILVNWKIDDLELARLRKDYLSDAVGEKYKHVRTQDPQDIDEYE